MRIREERRRRRHTYRETWIGSSSWNENCSRTISRINYWSTIYNLFTIRSPTIVAGRDSARAYARPSAHRIHAYERSKCRQTNWSFFYQSATTVWGKQLSTRGGGAFTGARTGHRFFSPPRFSRGISLCALLPTFPQRWIDHWSRSSVTARQNQLSVSAHVPLIERSPVRNCTRLRQRDRAATTEQKWQG